MLKVTIDNEEVLCNKDFTINEEMLNTSSTILNNVYPIEWEEDKDYVSRFYYPKDYSKCKIFDEIYHPETKEEVEGTSFSIEVDTTEQEELLSIKGQTSQDGTPTPESPIPVNVVSGRQVVSVCGKNLLSYMYAKGYSTTINGITWTINQDGSITANGTATSLSIFQFANADNLKSIIGKTIKLNGTPSNAPQDCFMGIYTASWSVIGNSYAGQDTNAITINDTATRVIARIPSGTTINNLTFYPMIRLSSITDTTYEEYKGTDYEINLGKNLFDDSTLNNQWISQNGTITTVAGSNSIKLNCKAGETYSLSTTYEDTSTGYEITAMAFYNSSGTLLNRQVRGSTTYQTITATAPTNTAYMYVGHYITKPLKIQLEKGQPTLYSPYKTPIYLGKIGNYQDYIFKNTPLSPLYDSNLEEGQWYIHKEIGRVVLNGTQNITLAGSGVRRFNANYTTLGITNIKEGTSNLDTAQYRLNDHFVYGTASTNFGNYYLYNNWLVLFDTNNTITDANTLKTWFSNNNTNICYVLNTPTNTLIEDEELINQLESIQLISGLNNVIVSSPYLPGIIKFLYNYAPAYTEEDLFFCGVVENTGSISLNPRYPHYCNLQILDFKHFLSIGETLDFVIYEKTIEEAIDQVISVIAPYGFVKGNINILHGEDVIGAYSTKDKTAYDVFNYIADITQSRWTTRMIDENTIAIDFYDPTLMPSGTAIEYNQNWFCDNKILDMSFNYSSRDYRNKQVMLSGEVYANISTTEIITADGYQTQFNTTDKIGYVQSILINGNPATIITKEEYDLGYEGDFIYQPGNPYFESDDLISTGAIITIVYYAVIEGREVVLNQSEISRINTMTGRKGVIARYENRNDATTTYELNQIGQSYLKYKGNPEIILKVQSLNNIWNIGERVVFSAPLTELATEYMVKKKTINYIATQNNIFYTFELTSSFNSETDINYFDNQRAKTMGNIGIGEYISRNIDIENEANVIFYDLEVNEVQVDGDSTLQSTLQSPLGVE